MLRARPACPWTDGLQLVGPLSHTPVMAVPASFGFPGGKFGSERR